jgi:hypothetical protein
MMFDAPSPAWSNKVAVVIARIHFAQGRTSADPIGQELDVGKVGVGALIVV